MHKGIHTITLKLLLVVNIEVLEGFSLHAWKGLERCNIYSNHLKNIFKANIYIIADKV